jgi:hypothetical protein
MKMSSGLKRFLAALGLIIVSGVIGNTISPNAAVKGVDTAVPILQKRTPTTEVTVIPTLAPVATETPTPTVTPTIYIQPTKKYIAPTATSIPAQTNSGLSNDNTYINSQGNEIHSPAYADSVPPGASAICGDGTYSFSGVAQWL